MIRLYYTGAADFLTDSAAYKSLGGYISSTKVSNAELDNLFPELSNKDRQDKKTSYRVLAIKNESQDDYSNINIKFVYLQNDNYYASMYKVGVEIPTVDSGGKLKAEQLSSIHDKPFVDMFFTREFDEGLQDYIDTPIAIESLGAQQYYLIYLSRTPLPNIDITEELLESGSILEEENIALNFQYDVS